MSNNALGASGAGSGLIISTHELCWLHDPGSGHPEAPDRLTAIRHGLTTSDVSEALTWVEAPDADRAVIEQVHIRSHFDHLQRLSAAGGGAIDPDTYVSADSAAAALRAAGAGLDLIDRLDDGQGVIGWSVVRPPGHHATPNKQMGFCLYNNIAVAARALAQRGERVAIVDVDAHHGNGTQDVFYNDPDVLFVSLHQYPWYPYTGAIDETGSGQGVGTTVNIPLPSGTTGDTYRLALDEVVAPVIERFEPTWLLVSAGFDGHRSDPLTDLGLTSADYADLIADIVRFVPAGRRLLFLEGGYDLRALSDCAGAVAASVLGERYRPEAASTGGPGQAEVMAAKRLHVDET